MFVSTVDRLLTAAMMVLALVGALRRVRRGQLDLPRWCSPACPPRCCSRPPTAARSSSGSTSSRFRSSRCSGRARSSRSDREAYGRRAGLAAACVGALLLAASCIAYYGKERAHRFSHDEVRASRWLHSSAPAGSLIVSGTFD